MILALSGGCTNATKADKPKKKTPADNPSSLTAEPEQEAEVLKEPGLNHTYTTKFGEINAITYPAFVFGYPDGWDIIKE